MTLCFIPGNRFRVESDIYVSSVTTQLGTDLSDQIWFYFPPLRK